MPALDELDFGAWTGRSFEALAGDPDWRLFNERRSLAAAPGGERILDVQARIVALMVELAGSHPDASLALVSHGDVIRSALLHFLGMPIDFIHRLDIAPRAVSVASLNSGACCVHSLNRTGGAVMNSRNPRVNTMLCLMPRAAAAVAGSL
jgi:broad specificity phosphatase PhoE